MSWTANHTFVVYDVLTVSQMQTISDNLDYLKGQTDKAPYIEMNDNAEHILSSSVTETDGNTFTIPAGAMGATGAVKFDFLVAISNTSGNNSDYTLKVYFGGSGITIKFATLANSGGAHFWVSVLVKNLNASAQVYQYSGYTDFTSSVGALMGSGTMAINTAGAVIIKNTHKWSVSHANNISDILWGRVELALTI
jgi:hypothetical protein